MKSNIGIFEKDNDAESLFLFVYRRLGAKETQ
jgi:hypothetical protein